ncbi:uncharacterized protein LOC130458171 isoform X4 [Monodelphis domestica]|uniref:uncharacterized protein LOC130458171 isoform X4 n=1 Tax=Monodelphis domestica TaxID=13616 RepID=UPI0024E1AC60|nr:uncharacterized protein LOC130458171 isoform X4 [Monodelphis domestica]
MEVLEEFDWEYPLTFTFCELISEEAFERQAVSYTERSLRRLFRSMDRNPALGERVVRKWKQEERERSGLTSFLAGRFFKALQGDLNYYNSVGALELQQRLDILKRRMQKLNIYAQEARRKKRKRRSHRLDHSPSTGGSVLSRSPGASTTSTRPPIPVTYMPRVFGPFPSLSDEQTETLAGPNSEMKVVQLNWTGLSSSPKRSPGLGSTTNPEDLAPTVGNASVFTPPVLLKFQPAPRPQEDAESDCDSKNLNSPSKAPQ